MRKHPLRAALGICFILALFFVGITWGLSGRGFSLDLDNQGKLGLVEIKGIIADAESTIADLREFQDNPKVKVIVLRVDSPGGGVGASQEIYREILHTVQIKPVVCSMGGVAASGGYYVASACSYIVANSGTLTGSIGVISSFPNLEGLFEKLGLRMEIIASGPLKGAGQPDRPLNQQERAMFEAMTKDLYEQFVADVAFGRGMTEEEVKAVADGRIMSGREALDLGLVDELGNYTDAIRRAAEKGGLGDGAEIIRPKDRRSWMETIWGKETASYWRSLLAAQPGPQYLYLP